MRVECLFGREFVRSGEVMTALVKLHPDTHTSSTPPSLSKLTVTAQACGQLSVHSRWARTSTPFFAPSTPDWFVPVDIVGVHNQHIDLPDTSSSSSSSTATVTSECIFATTSAVLDWQKLDHESGGIFIRFSIPHDVIPSHKGLCSTASYWIIITVEGWKRSATASFTSRIPFFVSGFGVNSRQYSTKSSELVTYLADTDARRLHLLDSSSGNIPNEDDDEFFLSDVIVHDTLVADSTAEKKREELKKLYCLFTSPPTITTYDIAGEGFRLCKLHVLASTTPTSSLVTSLVTKSKSNSSISSSSSSGSGSGSGNSSVSWDSAVKVLINADHEDTIGVIPASSSSASPGGGLTVHGHSIVFVQPGHNLSLGIDLSDATIPCAFALIRLIQVELRPDGSLVEEKIISSRVVSTECAVDVRVLLAVPVNTTGSFHSPLCSFVHRLEVEFFVDSSTAQSPSTSSGHTGVGAGVGVGAGRTSTRTAAWDPRRAARWICPVLIARTSSYRDSHQDMNACSDPVIMHSQDIF